MNNFPENINAKTNRALVKHRQDVYPNIMRSITSITHTHTHTHIYIYIKV